MTVDLIIRQSETLRRGDVVSAFVTVYTLVHVDDYLDCDDEQITFAELVYRIGGQTHAGRRYVLPERIYTELHRSGVHVDEVVWRPETPRVTGDGVRDVRFETEAEAKTRTASAIAQPSRYADLRPAEQAAA